MTQAREQAAAQQRWRFHGHFRSAAAYRCRIAFGLKKISTEFVPVHLRRGGGEQKPPGYRALNPQGLVPTLEVGSRFLTQSRDLSRAAAAAEHAVRAGGRARLCSGDLGRHPSAQQSPGARISQRAAASRPRGRRQLVSSSRPAYLFVVDDAPMQKKLGFYAMFG